MKKEIGGYFELELPEGNPDFPHHCNVLVNSGRHALESILRVLRQKGSVNRVFLPYYTCDVLLEPLRRLGIVSEFYHINENLEIRELPNLKDADFMIVNNYFGIKDAYIDSLIRTKPSKIIVDNAQAWYAPERLGVNAFYSPRKFFGVPDGGTAFVTGELNGQLEKSTSTDSSSHLLRRIDEGSKSGFNEFHLNSVKLKEKGIEEMSNLTRRLLKTIDYDWAKIKRRSNFEALHLALASANRMTIPDMKSFTCPMVYPYWTDRKDLRKNLIDNKVFVATYWPNVLKWCKEESLEYDFASNLIPLPIDQRYGEEEMKFIIDLVTK